MCESCLIQEEVLLSQTFEALFTTEGRWKEESCEISDVGKGEDPMHNQKESRNGSRESVGDRILDGRKEM